MDPKQPPAGQSSSSADEAGLLPVTLCECTTLTEAQMLVSLLASYGIRVRIDGENYFRLLGGMVPGFNGIRLEVRELDREAALEILQESAEPSSTAESSPTDLPENDDEDR